MNKFLYIKLVKAEHLHYKCRNIISYYIMFQTENRKNIHFNIHFTSLQNLRLTLSQFYILIFTEKGFKFIKTIKHTYFYI